MIDDEPLSYPILFAFCHILQLEVQVDVHGLDSSVTKHGAS